MLKQSLTQKMLQKLSPQQIQMIKLLEIPAMQIEQRIKKEIEENPALEEGEDEEITSSEQEEEVFEDGDQDEFSLDDYIQDDETPDYRLQASNYSRDDDRKDEIRVGLGQVMKLLHPESYALAKNAARSKCLEGMGDLITLVQGIVPGAHEGQNSVHAVIHPINKEIGHGRKKWNGKEQMDNPDPCHKHHPPGDAAYDHHRSKVGLHEDKNGEDHEENHMGHEPD